MAYITEVIPRMFEYIILLKLTTIYFFKFYFSAFLLKDFIF